MSKKAEALDPKGKAKELAGSQPIAGKGTKGNLKDWSDRASRNSYHSTDRDKGKRK